MVVILRMPCPALAHSREDGVDQPNGRHYGYEDDLEAPSHPKGPFDDAGVERMNGPGPKLGPRTPLLGEPYPRAYAGGQAQIGRGSTASPRE